MKRYLYFLLVVLCLTHAALATFAFIEGWCRVFYIWIATTAWFIWPVGLWLAKGRKWRLKLPLLVGSVLLLPAAAISLIWFICFLVTIPKLITAKRLTGNGDAGQFILETMENYGAVPRTTNGLPRIPGQWECTKYDDGTIEMKLPVGAFPDVQRFLKRSFGPPLGWGAGAWNLEYDLSTNGAVLEVYGGEITDFESTDVEFLQHIPVPPS